MISEFKNKSDFYMTQKPYYEKNLHKIWQAVDHKAFVCTPRFSDPKP